MSETAEAHAKAGRLGDAIVGFNEALRLQPRNALLCSRLAGVYLKAGDVRRAVNYYRRAVGLQPGLRTAHTGLLFALNYDPEAVPQAIFEEHVRWAARHAPPPVAAPRFDNDPSSARPLRIGYLSSDFYNHPVAFFFEPVLAAHNRDQFEIFLYSSGRRADAVTERMRMRANRWVDIQAMSDDEAEQRIRADRIDILVDLCGYTGTHRLPLFARKPAPVQFTWLGYPNTTGLSTIDYRITDSYADPACMTEHLHSERLLRLPQCFLRYQPHEFRVSASSTREGVVFGSFSKAAKLNENVVALWSRILHRLPGSHLLLHHMMGSYTQTTIDPAMRNRLIGLFKGNGIDKSRIKMIGGMPRNRHLALYDEIDVALDPFPYNGVTTTCESLYMGVPVVTLSGATHVSRVGVSLLSNVGHPEWIAATPDEYIEIALELAANPIGRKTLREQMLNSPIVKGSRLVTELESSYREAWRGALLCI